MNKILFIINTMGQAGAEMALIELLKRIDKEKNEVSLFVVTGQGEMISRVPEGVKLLNSTYIEKSVLNGEGRSYLKRTVIKALFRHANILRLFPYLFINFFRMVVNKKILPDKLLWRVVSDGAQRFDEKYDLAVAYIEGASAYYLADHIKADKKAAFVHVDYNLAGYSRKLDKNCYLKFDRIFGVSDEVRNVFIGAYPECSNRSMVFHNLLDVDGIRVKALENADFSLLESMAADKYGAIRRKINEAYNVTKKEQPQILLTVGRLTAQKSFEVSIEVCKRLKEKGENIVWYVLGEGNQRHILEKLILENGLTDTFYLPGAVSNPYPYLKNCDIYIHCSKFEGKSIAVQEAQILGKPIIVSDCSGNREQVENNVDGIICEFDEKIIAENVVNLLHNDDMCRRMGKAASEKNKVENNQIQYLFDLLI